MQDSLELIKDINWFLKPIASLFLYLFTTRTGIIILGICFVLYLIISVANAIWERKLMHLAARSTFGRGNLPFFEQVYVVLKELGRILANLVTKIPVLLTVFIIMAFVAGMSAGFESIENYIENERRIKELKTVVKHLDQQYKVAELKVIEQIYDPIQLKTTTKVELKYFDYAGIGVTTKPQEVTFQGNEIFFDAIVLNFEYSLIADGTHKNLTVPYKVFSNELPQSKGIKLDISNEDGVPYLFHRSPKDVWGMTPDRFNEMTKELMSYIKDEKSARENGIRSVYGNAVHLRLWPTSPVHEILIEQTGGLVIRPKAIF